jgi:hypothetical protein
MMLVDEMTSNFLMLGPLLGFSVKSVGKTKNLSLITEDFLVTFYIIKVILRECLV